MKQEEKELLLKDLSARLPYKVICTDLRHGDSIITEIDIIEETVYCDDFDEYVKLDQCKPYLRPMYSMTNEERAERIGLLWEFEGHINEDVTHKYQDWLNAHHLDYRGLIEKGLALEAPDEMYKIK